MDKQERITPKQHHSKMRINLSDKVKLCFSNDLRLMKSSPSKQCVCLRKQAIPASMMISTEKKKYFETDAGDEMLAHGMVFKSE